MLIMSLNVFSRSSAVVFSSPKIRSLTVKTESARKCSLAANRYKPADSISVGDVLRVLEGGLEAVTCSVNEGLGGCDAADFCVTRFVWQRINEGITNAVDSISLGELVQQSRQLEKNRNSDRNDKE